MITPASAADDIALMVALWQRPGTRDEALRLADLNRETKQRRCGRLANASELKEQT